MKSSRQGFTIVEALVGTMVMGIAGGMLAAAFTVASAARHRALLDTISAAALHERVATLSRRPCTATDTSGIEADGKRLVAWTARRTDAGWAYTDSVAVSGAPPRAARVGTVLCP